jgi:hypothetical protein
MLAPIYASATEEAHSRPGCGKTRSLREALRSGSAARITTSSGQTPRRQAENHNI